MFKGDPTQTRHPRTPIRSASEEPIVGIDLGQLRALMRGEQDVGSLLIQEYSPSPSMTAWSWSREDDTVQECGFSQDRSCNDAHVEDEKRVAGSPKKRRGRPQESNPEADRLLHADWLSSGCRTYKEFADKRGVKEIEVKRAIDRVRKPPKPPE